MIEAKRARDEQRERQEHRCDCSPTVEAFVYNPRGLKHERKCASHRGRACTCDKVEHQKNCSSRQDGACDCEPERYPIRGAVITESFRGRGALTAARKWRRELGGKVSSGEHREPVRETLRDAAETWLAGCERGEILSRYRRPYAPSALRGYRSDLERYVLPDYGDRKLSDVTAEDLQGLVERLTGKGLSGQKVRNVLVPVQALYRRYRRRVPVDPTHGLDLPEPAGRRERVAIPTEAAALLAPLPADEAAIYATALWAGLRRGELRALRVRHIRGLDGESVAAIRVEHSWDRCAGERDPKSRAGIRDVPMPETLRLILAEHVKRTSRDGDDFVFGRTATSPFAPEVVRERALRTWAKENARRAEAELEPLVPIGLHECRHSFKFLGRGWNF
jgi:integrase